MLLNSHMAIDMFKFRSPCLRCVVRKHSFVFFSSRSPELTSKSSHPEACRWCRCWDRGTGSTHHIRKKAIVSKSLCICHQTLRWTTQSRLCRTDLVIKVKERVEAQGCCPVGGGNVVTWLLCMLFWFWTHALRHFQTSSHVWSFAFSLLSGFTRWIALQTTNLSL